MFIIRPPSPVLLSRLLHEQAAAPLTYNAVGCTWGEADVPSGYKADRRKVTLGSGRAVFERACAAINAWRMFPQPMTQLIGRESPPQVGRTVLIVIPTPWLPLWGVFAARVLHVMDEPADAAHPRFGFAYGTTTEHAARGEERFLVTWDRATDIVEYEVFAVSRPYHPLARAGYFYMRQQQARFRRLSCAAMQAAVGELV